MVCVGDSNTHARLAGNFVSQLETSLGKNWVCVNAGLCGDTVEAIERRMDEIIDCEPDLVTLMAGTNNFRVMYREDWGRKAYSKGLIPAFPHTFEHFRAAYCRILQRLLNQTSAQMLCLSVPMMGEDLEARSNVEFVTPGNAIIAEIVAQCANPRVKFVDVHSVLKAELSLSESSDESAESQLTPPTLDESLIYERWSAVWHVLFGRSLDEIGSWRGMWFMHDGLHTNERGARLIAQTILANMPM